jgi:hypothetical protein
VSVNVRVPRIALADSTFAKSTSNDVLRFSAVATLEV